MILNSDTVQLVRANAMRLASCVNTKDDLTDFAAAMSFAEIFQAIEGILTNTDMYFDDELLSQLTEENWKNFRASLLVYTLNMVNRAQAVRPDSRSKVAGLDYRPGATA